MSEIYNELTKVSTKARAEAGAWFFKTGPGQYGEGDKFIGVSVPDQRKIAKKLQKSISLEKVEQSLASPWHEERLTSLIILVNKYKSATTTQKKEIVDFYLKNTKRINNWDLVDSSAPYILGDWLLDKDKQILYSLAKSDDLWERRISIITTLNFIRNGKFEVTLKLSEQLLSDNHDLIHKASGWCLREVGKKNEQVLMRFLDKFTLDMPRTMLRYAIERLPKDKREYYLKLK
jgi:3-methyladenine DNA glycosylase AlkD